MHLLDGRGMAIDKERIKWDMQRQRGVDRDKRTYAT